MNNSTPETPPENTPPAVPPIDNRRRLRELLSIPERDRSDEQWDEIIELEIQLAPGNRISGNDSGPGLDRSPMTHGKPSGGGVGQQQKKHRPRPNNNNNNNNRRPRQNKPPSSSGGSAT